MQVLTLIRICLTVSMLSLRAEAEEFIIDQANDPYPLDPDSTWFLVDPPVLPVAQEFVPSLTWLDFAELLFATRSDQTVELRIRQDTVNGPVLATTAVTGAAGMAVNGEYYS
jgi:hypothetical protein